MRETSASRYHAGPIEALLKTLGPLRHYRIEGFKGYPQLGPHYTEKRQSFGQQCVILSNLDGFASKLENLFRGGLFTVRVTFRVHFSMSLHDSDTKTNFKSYHILYRDSGRCPKLKKDRLV